MATGKTAMGVDVEAERAEWLAGAPARSPEVEQARFAGDVPDAHDLDLADINPYNPHLFREDRWHDHFARLRREDPVHLNELASAGRYWSITTWDAIREAESDWRRFSSEPSIVLGPPIGAPLPKSIDQVTSFIAMDPPEHEQQRITVRRSTTPAANKVYEPLIRERVGGVLDALPVGETFNWVERVSVELTAMMLATLFGIPLEDRHKLMRWSDVATTIPEPGGLVESTAQRRAELVELVTYFDALWDRRRTDPGDDLVSMLAHGEATRDMTPLQQVGNLMLLIIGGNDTTRNTMSGSVYAFNEFPEQFEALRADPSLVDNLAHEIIRWQTPLNYMRRTATDDCEFRGRDIKRDDQVLLWYVSANRDESVFDDADSFDLRRPNANRHVAFGHGIHYCMGARLAEMQVRVLWEEILRREMRVELQAEPTRTFSSFIHGYLDVPVRIVCA
ncbi:MAG: cytochrome P450 [Actinomycetota bacterium]